jgi:tetratricopeptide (TPR) repeat protein
MRRFFNLVLIVLVMLFAFLAASFAVRNSDFWLHLASGRLLAEGRFPFGKDPFAFTTENHYWANHAWLFDLPLYLLYNRLGEQLGGPVLVVLKALLVSLLALVLLAVRRPDSRLGWPAACTLLAVLAMSPRLLLHSTCLSYFLLALTLWLLWRPLQQGASFGQQLRHYLPLLLLFVLWVNVDGWFLLGPLLAALFWLGDWIAPRKAGLSPVSPNGSARTPGWLWLAGVAVCLINPYHVYAFTLPMELMPLPDALRNDVRFAQLHASPWRMNLYYGSLIGVNLARVAYLVLLAAGALSFLLNLRSLAGWRLLVWLTFAGLSAWLVGTIPFFVIVAAPITALNLQDAFSTRQATRGFLVLGPSYFALVVSSLALIGLAWPGWLQGFQDRGRHVDWAVRPDGSLRRVAETLHLWHGQGKFGIGRGFLYHPSLVHYCAYYCPEEQGFLDLRLPLFRDVAGPYEDICQALIPSLTSGRIESSSGWRSRLRDWGITHLVLYDPELRHLVPALRQLANEKGTWTLLDIDGQALILGWRERNGNMPQGVKPFDAQRLAFSTAVANEHEALLAEAPGQGPQRGPRPDDFWAHFGKAIAPSPWQSEAAAVLLDYFELHAPYEIEKRFHWAIALLGMPALSSGSMDSLMRLAAHLGHAPPNPLSLAEQSPALPLLSIRAARQALAENPDDANAYLQLGLAYLALARQTPENVDLDLMRPFAELRHIQIATALENALRRDPNSLHSLRAHEELAMLYAGRFPPFLNPPFLDAALEHRRAILHLLRRIGPVPGEAADAFARRLREGERNIQELERAVSDRKNEFSLRTRSLGSEPYRKAELALRMGLGRLALEDVLMPTSIVLLGGEGIRLQVRLQLMLGQLDLVRDQLHSADWKANKANLGLITLEMPGNTAAPTYELPAYEWLLLCQTAADGDYDRAQADVKEQLRLMSQQQQQLALSRRELRSRITRILRMEIALRATPQIVARGMVEQVRTEMTSQLAEQLRCYDEVEKQHIRTGVMLQVVAGMLAMEQGRPQQAKQAFRQALSVSRQGQDPSASAPGVSMTQTYLRLLEAATANVR